MTVSEPVVITESPVKMDVSEMQLVAAAVAVAVAEGSVAVTVSEMLAVTESPVKVTVSAMLVVAETVVLAVIVAVGDGQSHEAGSSRSILSRWSCLRKRCR